jgi:SAM-dependent methyltransferase
MVALTGARLRGWPSRAAVVRVDGRNRWPLPDRSTDRVVCVYVLDLLAPADIETFFAEAARVLRPDGLVAVASLTPAPGGPAHLISSGWLRLWRLNPRLTGGCRPVDLASRLPTGWSVRTDQTITSFGITSAVMIAEPPQR